MKIKYIVLVVISILVSTNIKAQTCSNFLEYGEVQTSLALKNIESTPNDKYDSIKYLLTCRNKIYFTDALFACIYECDWNEAFSTDDLYSFVYYKDEKIESNLIIKIEDGTILLIDHLSSSPTIIKGEIDPLTTTTLWEVMKTM